MDFDSSLLSQDLFGRNLGRPLPYEKTVHLEDEALMQALLEADPEMILRVLKDLGVEDAETRLIATRFGMRVGSRFTFYSIHHFLDALEKPSLLSSKEQEAIIPIVQAFLREEVTGVIAQLKTTPAPEMTRIYGYCA